MKRNNHVTKYEVRHCFLNDVVQRIVTRVEHVTIATGLVDSSDIELLVARVGTIAMASYKASVLC